MTEMKNECKELNQVTGSVTYEVKWSWEGGEVLTLDTWKCHKAASEDVKDFEAVGYDNVHINRVVRHLSQNVEGMHR